MSDATVRLATAADLDQLGVVGPAAYAEAYAYLWADPGAYARQLATFGRAAFAEFLVWPEARVWVAEAEGAVVGFLTLVLGSPDPVEGRPGGAEVPRICLLGPARRLGLGRRLLDAAEAQATREGASHLWLDAMASADWARRAYTSWGFRQIGVARFDKGVRDELSDMVVMVRELA